MADEYIKRQALLDAYDAAHKGPPGGARKLIAEVPAEDVVPVVHGRWIPKADGFWKKQILICSKCESRNGLNYEFNYCPNCGARMDGE